MTPQWFKDAIRDWPTVFWLPIPKQAGLDGRVGAVLSPDYMGATPEQVMLTTEGSIPPFETAFRNNPLTQSDGAYARTGNVKILLPYQLPPGIIVIVGFEAHDAYPYYADYIHNGKIEGAISIVMEKDDYRNLTLQTDGFDYLYYDQSSNTDSGFRYNPKTAMKGLEPLYRKPQYKAAVFGFSQNGDGVVGTKHPLYSSDGMPYLDDYEELSSLRLGSEISSLKLERWIRSIRVQSVMHSISYIEIKTPWLRSIDWPSADGEAWWKNKINMQEAEFSGGDKRGFPIG